jgi:hypothetical protein
MYTESIESPSDSHTCFNCKKKYAEYDKLVNHINNCFESFIYYTYRTNSIYLNKIGNTYPAIEKRIKAFLLKIRNQRQDNQINNLLQLDNNDNNNHGSITHDNQIGNNCVYCNLIYNVNTNNPNKYLLHLNLQHLNKNLLH